MAKSINEITAKEKKRYLKNLFRGYRGMTHQLEQNLGALGFQVKRTKKHIRLYYNRMRFTCPSTPSDFRSGVNFAAALCRVLEQEKVIPLPTQTPTDRISA